MQTRLQNPFFNVIIALGLALALSVAAHAQPVDEPASSKPVAADTAVVAPEDTPKEVEISDEIPAGETTVTVADEAPTEASKIDSAEESLEEVVAEDSTEGKDTTEIAVDAAKVKVHGRHRHRHQVKMPLGNHTVPHGMVVREIVSIWGSSILEGEAQRSVVSVLGDTVVKGKVRGEATAILGNMTVEGEVRYGTVAVLGDTIMTGKVGGEVITVMGDAYIDGEVEREVVVVLGNLTLGPDAVINRGLTIVGGKLLRDSQAVVHGSVSKIDFLGDDPNGTKMEALRTWVRECFVMGRPLAFNGKVAWAWVVAIVVFALYVVVAIMFPKPLEKCVETLEQRPGYSMLAVILTALISPLVVVLLAITGIGAILLPFIVLGTILGTIFGKVVMHAWLGRRFTKYFGEGPLGHVSVATLVGSCLILLLYTVPFLGFFLWKVLGMIGWGVVVYALILRSRRDKPAIPRQAVRATPIAVAPPPMGATEQDATGIPIPPELPLTVMPRAGFWIRLLASALDMIVVAVVVNLLFISALFIPLVATYCVVLWALKGTTIGGIICGLRVVRLDERPVDWSIAIVRVLAGFLSFIVAGLGFIWVAFDEGRQSWHDKIAGTVVVRAPKGGSLI